MKKKLSHIFDRAEASELETLIDQNKAPEVSADTLASIQNKVYEKTGINKVKPKKPLMLRWQSLAAAAVCLCLVVGLMFGTGLFPMPIAQAAEADTTEVDPSMQELIQNLEVERKNPEDINLDANTIAMFIDEENNLVLMSSTEILFHRPLAECGGIFIGWASSLSSQVLKLRGIETSLLVFQSLFDKVQYLSIDEEFSNDRILKEMNYGFCFSFNLDDPSKREELLLVAFYDGTIVFKGENDVYYVSEKESIDLIALEKQIG